MIFHTDPDYTGLNTDLFVYEAQGIFLIGIHQGYGRFSLGTQKPHDQANDAFKATANELQKLGRS